MFGVIKLNPDIYIYIYIYYMFSKVLQIARIFIIDTRYLVLRKSLHIDNNMLKIEELEREIIYLTTCYSNQNLSKWYSSVDLPKKRKCWCKILVRGGKSSLIYGFPQYYGDCSTWLENYSTANVLMTLWEDISKPTR